jgi:hypothetical protein
MTCLVAINYKSSDGLERASRQSVRVAVRIPDEFKSRNLGGKPFAISEMDSGMYVESGGLGTVSEST